MIYEIPNYYSCYCGGTFYVDLKAKIYGIAPCKYNYICSRCGKRKAMFCREEIESLVKVGVVNVTKLVTSNDS